MDLKQTETILKRLELGEHLSRICKDKDLPDVSTVYKHCRKDEKLQKKIMSARQLGVFTLLDKMSEEMEVPKTPQETHFYRERWNNIKWLASKLASSTFGDKSKVEQKIDNHLTISWKLDKHEENIKLAQKVEEQIPSTPITSLPGAG